MLNFRTFLGASITVLPIVASGQNLLANSSFESIVIESSALSIPAPGNTSNWNAAYASMLIRSGYSWDGGTTVNAQTGNQYLRLDGHSVNQNAGLIQQFVTELQIGQQYRLSFWYTGASSLANSSFFYGFEGVGTSVNGVTGVLWRPFSADFIARSSSASVSFGGGGISTQPPIFLDNVSLTAVPEPRPILALPFGLLAIIAFRKYVVRRA